MPRACFPCCTTTARRSPRATSSSRSRSMQPRAPWSPSRRWFHEPAHTNHESRITNYGRPGKAMTYIAKPKLHHPTLARNKVGYTRRDYEGAVSTLCAGCGHDSISAAIVQACWELDIEPHRVAKLSGIGWSSKTPTYFLGNSHGFNSVHGRMPSVLTGANLANRDLLYLGVSGDGDTASIGLGQFAHSVRRGVNMVYIVAN